MTGRNSHSPDPHGLGAGFSAGNQAARMSSSGMARAGLFLGTNLAVVAVATVVAAALGIDPSGILGITVFSLVIGMGGSVVSLMMSKSVAKRATRAQVIDQPVNDVERWLMSTVQRLSEQAQIGMPEVAVFPSDAPNAFATGAKRDSALVAVSAGLLRTMDRREVEAVLAHEIAHVANGDMITLTLVQGVTNSLVILVSRVLAAFFRENTIIYFAVLLFLQFGLGLLASIIVMWFSRKREFRADAGAAAMVGPAAMASALSRLEQASAVDPRQDLPDEVAAFGIRSGRSARGLSNRASASSKSRAAGGLWSKLFASHPPIASRIEALQTG